MDDDYDMDKPFTHQQGAYFFYFAIWLGVLAVTITLECFFAICEVTMKKHKKSQYEKRMEKLRIQEEK